MMRCPSPPSLGIKGSRNNPNIRKIVNPCGIADIWQKCTIRRKQLNGISRNSHERGFTRTTAKSRVPGGGQQSKPGEPMCSKYLPVMIKVYESHQSCVGHATVPELDTVGPRAATGSAWVLKGDQCVETLFQGLG